MPSSPRIPFGKYKGQLLSSIPHAYLAWIQIHLPSFWIEYAKEEDSDQYGKPRNATRLDLLIRSHGNAQALSGGKWVHARILKFGHGQNGFLSNLVIEMYGKCGAFENAWQVFDRMDMPNVYSWNIIMASLVSSNKVEDAQKIFDEMPNRDVVSWNEMITAYAHVGRMEEAKEMFKRMPMQDVISWNALIAAYGIQGSLPDALILFNRMPLKNIVSWNSIITAYAQQGCIEAALDFYRQLYVDVMNPNKVTFICILDVCSNQAALTIGKWLHAKVICCGFELDATLGSALIDMYGKCVSLKDACTTFGILSHRNIVSWTIMLSAYAQQGNGRETFTLFQQMLLEGVKPDEVTFPSILAACACEATLAEGKWMHICIIGSGFEPDVVVGSSLIDMYGKCGSLEDAQYVFDNMPERNLVSWTAILAAYAQHGHGREAYKISKYLHAEGHLPDQVLFIILLSACSRAGLIDEGIHCFTTIRDHFITVTADHYTCIIDLLGRVGWLVEAEDLLNAMTLESTATLWTSLLGACKIYGDVKRGIQTSQCVFALDPNDDAPYLLLSNIYAAAGMWAETARIRKVTYNNGLHNWINNMD